MSISKHIARSNRLKNAGGCYPDALPYATTLAILLAKLAKVDVKTRPAITVVALFMWLTEDWRIIDKPDDIPDFIRISGASPCRQYAFRNYYDSTVSWTEYARACKDKNKTTYLWQPIPTYLNQFFQTFISEKTYDTPFLTQKAKTILFELMSKAWKTPHKLQGQPRVRKDSLQNYFIKCAQADNTLGAIVRVQLIADQQAHHRSARYYQQQSSDRIRRKIFDAHNRYLSRLIAAARNAKINSYFVVYLKSYSVSLIKDNHEKAKYLSIPGIIKQFELDTSQNGESKVCTPAIMLGSRRSLDDKNVSLFFQSLQKEVEDAKESIYVKCSSQKSSSANHAALRDYYNKATYRIALLFIVLTGARPTHSISILSDYYSGSDITFIKDKGVLRQLILCDYLQQEIKHYLSLQTVIRSQLNIHTELDELWYTCNEKNIPIALTCRELRLFMHKLWPGVVPYHLRHFYCHCANSHMFSDKLFDNDIDRLMGHENLGERLGSDILSPRRFALMKDYLNMLSQRIGLEALIHV
ncbi:hypothetical protein [Pseudoalteromonas translucida]|uniref:Orphan protein n=1 Tax=Pseudoalteromonas translucida (strain TAC 125) TaxID=326442 RepID=Q3IEH6_PSET1|nr:hypothetical protein [Pseudoalteromonas translucida]CAI85522.1 putative orphan protein [Pseudoalteromonas translucida]